MDNMMVEKYKEIKRRKELIHLFFMAGGLLCLYLLLNFLIERSAFFLKEGELLNQNIFVMVLVLLLLLTGLIIAGLITFTKIATKLYPKYKKIVICSNIVDLKLLLSNLYPEEKTGIDDFISVFKFKIEACYNNEYTAFKIDKIIVLYQDYNTLLKKMNYDA